MGGKVALVISMVMQCSIVTVPHFAPPFAAPHRVAKEEERSVRYTLMMSADVLWSRETPNGDRLQCGAAATLIPRSSAPDVVAATATTLYGYAEQRSRLASLVERAAPATVGIWGPAGVGKTEMLAFAAAAEGEWPDGRIMLSARDASPQDIIALLCDALFNVDAGRARPPSTACINAIAKRRLVVALDDLRSLADLPVLRATLANSLLIFTTARPSSGDGVVWVGLQGLTADGVSLLRAAVGESVPAELAVAIVHALGGNPGRIVRVGRLGIPLENIAASGEAFDDLSLVRARDVLSPDDLLLLAAAATFGDVVLGEEPPPALVELGFLQRSPLGWAVPEGLRERVAQDRDPVALAGVALEALRSGAPAFADPSKLPAVAAGLVRTLKTGGTPAIDACRALAPLLDGYGLWSVSTELYEALRALGREHDDPELQAWAAHQVGVRRACAGKYEAARASFLEALADRQAVNDEAGQAATAENLALLSQLARSQEESATRTRPRAGRSRTVARPSTRLAAVAIGGFTLVLALVLWLALRPPAEDVAQTAAQAGTSLAGHAAPATRASFAASSVAVPLHKRHAKVRAAAAPPRPRSVPIRIALALSTPGRVPAPPTAHSIAASPTATPVPPRPAAARAHRRSGAPSAFGVSTLASAGQRAALQPLRYAGTPHIVLLSLLPTAIARGQRATLCVSAANAQRLTVSSWGALDPRQTTCRSVSPSQTTSYVARAASGPVRSSRTITLEVRTELSAETAPAPP